MATASVTIPATTTHVYDELFAATLAAAPKMVGPIPITPAEAAELLEHNKKNRDKKEVRGNIGKLVRTMRTPGLWNLDVAQVMAFYKDGSGLADGQCRLFAAVEAAVTLPAVYFMAVAENEGEGEGKPRTFAQYLAMRGAAHPLTVGPITKEWFREQDEKGKGAPGIPELMAFYLANRGFIDETAKVAHGWLDEIDLTRTIASPAQAGIARMMAVQFMGIATEQVDQYLDAVLRGDPSNPQAVLAHESLQRKDDDRNRQQVLKVLLFTLQRWARKGKPVNPKMSRTVIKHWRPTR